MTDQPKPPSSGSRVLHYSLSEQIGQGGMGVVWKATDTSLDREVAVKILPPAFAADAERLARFEREARLLASLNHPNIATVHSVHEVEGDRYLVMELVPGEDLAHRVERGPVPVPEAIEIARQIALALEAAHESGVIHRDLKPANVRITPDDRIKVLDFGLAKAMEPTAPSGAQLSQSPTMASAMTSGMIIGTAAYMSPEQARGQAVDRRADIWAFGVVLYEMLTGRQAFEGDTVSDILAAVLRAEPDPNALPADLPRPLRRLLERCLDKNPRRRLRDIGEAVILLEDMQSGSADGEPDPAGTGPAPAPSSGRHRLAWGAGLIAAMALGAAGVWMLRPAPPEPPLRKITLALDLQNVSDPIVSPDGRHIAFLQGGGLWVRDLDQLAPRRLADEATTGFRPIWSPTGTDLAFMSGRQLVRVGVAGGGVVPVCPVESLSGGGGGYWSPDGHIVFARGRDHLYTVPAGGGLAEIHTAAVDSVDADIHHPFLLPDDQGILLVRHRITGGPRTLSVIRDGVFTDLLTLESGYFWEPVYDPRGYVIVTRLGTGAGLWAAPMALDPPRLTGDPFLITPVSASPSVASDGTLVYQLGSGQAISSSLVTVDRAGQVIETWAEPEFGNRSMFPSPDGTRVAMEIWGQTGDSDLWIHDLSRSSKTRFAFGEGRQYGATWSPDGRTIVYGSDNTLMVRPADGSVEAQPLGRGRFPAFTPDGRHVVYTIGGESVDIWLRSVSDPADSSLVLGTPADEFDPGVSPNGRFLVYSSDESGTREVYLRQFPEGSARWQVSSNGGINPQWSPAGDRIYYLQGGELMEVDVELEPEVRLGNPRLMFRLLTVGLQEWGHYVIRPTGDPDRFLALRLATSNQNTSVVVVDNWVREFEQAP